MKKITSLLVILACLVTKVSANTVELNNNKVTIKGEQGQILQYKGKTSILLKNARAQINALEFTNGIIEYDVAFSSKRAFAGVSFRQQDANNAEEFYIRPHQSGNPDANQYSPVYNDLQAWQLYSKGFSAKINYNFDDWNHVKIVVAGKRGEVFINDMSVPAFAIEEFLRPTASGGISFYANINEVYYSNISIVKNNTPALQSTFDTAQSNKVSDRISQWTISDSFHQNKIEDVIKLDQKAFSQLNWQPLAADNYGVLNLARVQTATREAHTTFAKVTLHSDVEQIKALQFGYSDKVNLYVNNTLMYAGDNTFRTRDYRYLGTIGLFDTIYVPLKKGKNEIVFAVAELFGGWGVTAKFENNKHITFSH